VQLDLVSRPNLNWFSNALPKRLRCRLFGSVASMRASAAITKKSATDTSVQKSCHIDSRVTFTESAS